MRRDPDKSGQALTGLMETWNGIEFDNKGTRDKKQGTGRQGTRRQETRHKKQEDKKQEARHRKKRHKTQGTRSKAL